MSALFSIVGIIGPPDTLFQIICPPISRAGWLHFLLLARFCCPVTGAFRLVQIVFRCTLRSFWLFSRRLRLLGLRTNSKIYYETNYEKGSNLEVLGGLKPSPNPSQSWSKSRFEKKSFFTIVDSFFLWISENAHLWFYRHGQCFVRLFKNQLFQFWSRLVSKKTFKNLSKTRSGP